MITTGGTLSRRDGITKMCLAAILSKHTGHTERFGSGSLTGPSRRVTVSHRESSSGRKWTSGATQDTIAGVDQKNQHPRRWGSYSWKVSSIPPVIEFITAWLNECDMGSSNGCHLTLVALYSLQIQYNSAVYRRTRLGCSDL